MSWRRLLAMIRKELIQLRRDRRTAAFVLVGPVLELVMFGYIGTTNVRHLPTVVFDQSHTAASRAFAAAFQNAGAFDLHGQVSSADDALQMIDAGAARVALMIPADFGDQVLTGKPAQVQLVVDGSDTNVAQSALAAGTAIAQVQSQQMLAAVVTRRGQGDSGQAGVGQGGAGQGGVDLRTVVRYNPSLQSAESIVPGLVGLFVPFQAMLLTAFAVVRERERGTLEQLVVTPINSLELMLGKVVPNVVLTFVSMLMSLGVARLLFGVEIAGSLPLLLLLTIPFLLGSLGIGLLISVGSRTQTQAQQAAQLTLLPSFFVSGILFPREGLPPILQLLGNLIPQTYFIEIVRGIMLKGVGLAALWAPALGLSVFGLVVFTVAVLQFRKRID